ncbi:MAG: hypothetical protein P9L92_20995 [Candidatus Electryonea clarkiae]|nr:hypothetical protein [Candidatus Electryonea clarkiae]MDP8285674.1 hypothetical protein [Candidatus Electryonea clarkiae]
MRTWIISITLICLIAGSSFAGNERTLLGSMEWHNSGMGAMRPAIGALNGETAFLNGARGQWIINHKVGVGIGTYSADFISDYHYDGVTYNMNVEYIGLETEYFFNSGKLYHPSLLLMAGGGIINFNDDDDHFDSDEYDKSYGFLFVYPAATFELNVTSWFRTAIEVGWRQAFGVDDKGLGNADMSGWTTGLNLKFGKF